MPPCESLLSTLHQCEVDSRLKLFAVLLNIYCFAFLSLIFMCFCKHVWSFIHSHIILLWVLFVISVFFRIWAGACKCLFQTLVLCINHSFFFFLMCCWAKTGENDLPGLTDIEKPRMRGPKRASKIRKLFNLSKEEDVRKYVNTYRRTFTTKTGLLAFLIEVVMYCVHNLLNNN